MQEKYLLLEEHSGATWIYTLIIDVSQDDIPASSERGTYSAAAFTALVASENIDCMRQIAGILQRFAEGSEALRECFADLDKSRKESAEKDGAEREEARLRALQNGERYRLVARGPDAACVWGHLLDESFKVPQSEKELEEEYFMWERCMWQSLRSDLGQLSAYWLKSLCAPTSGVDRICYNRHANPTLSVFMNNNTVDLTDESVRSGMEAVEFKQKLVNGMTFNHPFDSVQKIIVTELPGDDFEHMIDEKRFRCDVKGRSSCFLILGNIHRPDDQSTTPLGQSTMNLKTIIVVGFMELLRESVQKHLEVKRFVPTQKAAPAKPKTAAKAARGAKRARAA